MITHKIHKKLTTNTAILPFSKEKLLKSSGNTRERKRLIRYADQAVSYYVIHRDKYCVTCGTNEGLTCSHLFRRGRHMLRYDLENCNCQCATCNESHNSNPKPYEDYFIKKYSKKKLDELYVRAWGLHKYSTYELQLVVKNMEKLNKQFFT